RLSNPRGRRRMTRKQIKFFGTKRQKAALKNRSGHRKRNLGRKRKRNQGGILTQAEHAAERAIRSVEQAAEEAIGTRTRQVNRRRNVGEILTVLPANPGRRRRHRKSMARTKNRRRRANRGRVANRRHRRVYSRRRNRVYNRRRRNRNPKVVVRYRNRRRHNY